MLRLFVFIVLSLTSYSVVSQCIHELTPHIDIDQVAYDAHIKSFISNKKSNKRDRVGLTVHLVESVQGVSGLNNDNIQNIINTVNRNFSDAGVEFFLCGAPRNISGDQSFTRTQTSELNAKEHEPNTLNIYFVEDYITESGGLAGFAFFPWTFTPKERYVTLSWNVQSVAGLLSHELGHFYGLYHTHERFFGLEYVNGSNCNTAGDLMCDTPADYNLLNSQFLGGCLVFTDLSDLNGDIYRPDPSNIMSYARSECLKRFSPEQSARINYYHTMDNNYLISECTFPDFIISSTESNRVIRADENLNLKYTLDLIALEDQEQIEVYFWLSDDPNNLGTIIQKDTVDFDTATSYDLDFDLDFPINRSTGTYFLTVQVDPEFKVLEQEEGNNLHQILVTVDNSNLSDELVFANPTSDKLKLFLRNKSNIKTDMVISIWDHLGRLYHQVDAFKNRDEYFEEIDVSHLNPGLYILEAYFPEKGRSQAFNFYKG